MNRLRRAIAALSLLIAFVLIGNGAMAQVIANCPTGPSYPPGFWQQERCIVTNPPGLPCLVNICYCWHQGDGTPSNPDYYYITAIEATSPNCLDNIPAQTVIDASRKAILQSYLQGEDGGGCNPSDPPRNVVIKNSRCYTYQMIDDPMTHRHIWKPCACDGACTQTYLIICPSTIQLVGGSQEGPPDLICPEGCTQVTCP
jgi:hypothetical protein